MDDNLAAGTRGNFDLLTNVIHGSDTLTVTRIIGRLLAIPSVVANATVSAQRVSIGIGVSSPEAFAAGALPLPEVMTDFPPRGWLYREHGILVNQQDSGTVEAWHFPEFVFDIRGQRKIDKGTLFMSWTQEDLIAGTTTTKLVGLVRVLCLS